MFINRYTKIILTIALALAGRQFFGMDEMASSTIPTTAVTAAAEPEIAAPGSPEEQLIDACYAVNLVKVKELLDRTDIQANVNAVNKNGNTPLLALTQAYWRRWEKAADYNMQDFMQQNQCETHHLATQLIIAARLIKRGADVNAQNKDGNTALMFAVSFERMPQDFISSSPGGMVKCLVEHGNANINAHNSAGQTALMWAAKHATLDAIQYLVKRGADIYARDNDGDPALTWATNYYNHDVTQYLATVMAQRQSLFALLLCDKFAPSGDSSFIDFPPELIDRVLRPTIMAAIIADKR